MGNEHRIPMDSEYRIGVRSFEKFAAIQEQIKNCPRNDIIVDCRQTTYISPAFATIFGSLPHYGELLKKRVTIEYNKITGKRYITDIGIERYYNNTPIKFVKTAAVPFSPVDFVEYEKDPLPVIQSILDQLPVSLSEEEEGLLIFVLGEIFNNAKDHSGVKTNKSIRAYYCGYWNAKKDTYIVTIGDTGVGIAENVSNYLGKKTNDVEALNWAFGDGNSTQNTADLDYTRGIGLNSLEKFINANKGSLYIASGSAIAIVKDGRTSIKRLDKSILGTTYVFTLNVNQHEANKLVI